MIDFSHTEEDRCSLILYLVLCLIIERISYLKRALHVHGAYGLSRISGKSKLAEAIRYGLTRKAEFGRFLEDGRIEIDNNSVERAIRPQTITRKNALFAGSEAGGHTWATIASLLATARLNDIDPNAWLAQTLERIAQGWPNKDIDALLPWNFKNN
jgi:transposase